MHVWALTGGIATGKSTACAMLGDAVPGLRLFDCDASVRRLLAEDGEVVAEIVAAFGGGARAADGGVNRAFLRECVFADAGLRERLESIVHPRVRKECLDSLASAAREGAALFVADVPLLFEKGFDFGQQGSLLIAVSRATQIQRLHARDGFDPVLIDAILAAQWPMEEKLRRADVVFWNEGPPDILRAQIHRFSHHCI